MVNASSVAIFLKRGLDLTPVTGFGDEILSFKNGGNVDAAANVDKFLITVLRFIVRVLALKNNNKEGAPQYQRYGKLIIPAAPACKKVSKTVVFNNPFGSYADIYPTSSIRFFGFLP